MSTDTRPATAARLPFAGLRVLDVSQGISGPYCAHVLWQQGADVVKVEPPSGDWSRGMGLMRDGTSSLLVAFNGGKRGICVDATREEGRAVLRRLADGVDVIVENFRPGVASRLGLDPAELRAKRPELVYVSISGYGKEGPYAGAPATDSVVQADAGFMFSNRGADATPRKIGVYLADVNSGLYAAQAVSAALYRRALGGGGEHIEVNLFDTCAATLVCNFVEHAMDPARESRPVLPPSAPNGTFATSDGAINLVTLNDEQFGRICKALERPAWAQDPRFADAGARMTNMPALHEMVADAMKRMPSAHWMHRFKQYDVLHAPVRSYSQCIEHPQAKYMGTFEPLDQPGIGPLVIPGTPVRAFRRPIAPAPRIGEHTESVLEAAGFDAQERARLLQAGVAVQRT